MRIRQRRAYGRGTVVEMVCRAPALLMITTSAPMPNGRNPPHENAGRSTNVRCELARTNVLAKSESSPARGNVTDAPPTLLPSVKCIVMLSTKMPPGGAVTTRLTLGVTTAEGAGADAPTRIPALEQTNEVALMDPPVNPVTAAEADADVGFVTI